MAHHHPDFATKGMSWNASRIVGPKPPLRPKHIWAIRQQLKNARRVRDLALVNCAIDSKLRGCDLVSLRVSDLALACVLRQRAMVVQRKTRRPVPFVLLTWLRGRP